MRDTITPQGLISGIKLDKLWCTGGVTISEDGKVIGNHLYINFIKGNRKYQVEINTSDIIYLEEGKWQVDYIIQNELDKF